MTPPIEGPGDYGHGFRLSVWSGDDGLEYFQNAFPVLTVETFMVAMMLCYIGASVGKVARIQLTGQTGYILFLWSRQNGIELVTGVESPLRIAEWMKALGLDMPRKL